MKSLKTPYHSSRIAVAYEDKSGRKITSHLSVFTEGDILDLHMN